MDRERIWQRNAELGEVGRMCRIARLRNVQIPFLHLESAVAQVASLLIGGNNRTRPAYDKRTDADLVFELALAFAVLSSTPSVPGARRLHVSLHNELMRRNAQDQVALALECISPSEVIAVDAIMESSPEVLEPPDPFTIISRRY